MTAVRVIGVDRAEHRCVEKVLDHGADPRLLLLEHGWDAGDLVRIDGAHPEIEVVYRVTPAARRPAPPRAPRVDVTSGRAATAVPYQRVAAYAIVESDRGLLLTEYSDRTARAGSWGLPGGGVDPQESPADAVRREAWEESGQLIVLDAPVDVITDHWVGEAPNGNVEDFHAVRLIYRSHCDHPTDPVVHDIGGTTRSAAWWPRAQLGRLEVIPWTRALLAVSDERPTRHRAQPP